MIKKIFQEFYLLWKVLSGNLEPEDIDLKNDPADYLNEYKSELDSEVISVSLSHVEQRYDSLETRWHAWDNKVSILIAINAILIGLAKFSESVNISNILITSGTALTVGLTALFLPYMGLINIESFDTFSLKLNKIKAEYLLMKLKKASIEFNQNRMDLKVRMILFAAILTILSLVVSLTSLYLG